MMANDAPSEAQPPARGGDIVYRHRIATRVWHWINALSLFVMLMSGLMIFNAHPHLYWGKYGANFDHSWLDITPGHLRVGPLHIPTPGLLGVTPHGGRFVAFPPWATIPVHYNLAGARQWHFAFAWLLVSSIWSAFAARRRARDAGVSLIGYALAVAVFVIGVMFAFFDGLSFPISAGTLFLLIGLCGSLRHVGTTESFEVTPPGR